MNISTVNAIAGLKTVTVTNPDGQSSTGAGLLTVLGGPALVIETPQPGGRRPAARRARLGVRGRRRVGSGIDAVHVYATPAGGAPVFLGAARVRRVAARRVAAIRRRSSRRRLLVAGRAGAGAGALHHHRVRPQHRDRHLQRQPVGRRHAEGARRRRLGAVDTPADNATVPGEMGVTGWAVDEAGVSDVDIYRSPLPSEGTEPVFIGQAVFSRGARPDVQAAFPTHVGQRRRRLGLHGADEHAARTRGTARSPSTRTRRTTRARPRCSARGG